MASAFLRTVANRCLAAERECSEPGSKKEFREIAQQLLRRANEMDGKVPPVAIRRGAPSDRKGDPD
jgi:hypothetical protein